MTAPTQSPGLCPGAPGGLILALQPLPSTRGIASNNLQDTSWVFAHLKAA